MRANSNTHLHSVNSRGGIRKPSLSQHRSISTTQVDRLHQLALQQANPNDITSLPPTSIGTQWLTPQHSPQPQVFPEPFIEQPPHWTVPTPPRSESGVPSVSVDSNEEPVTSGIGSTQDFAFGQATASADMRHVIDGDDEDELFANERPAHLVSCYLRNTEPDSWSRSPVVCATDSHFGRLQN